MNVARIEPQPDGSLAFYSPYDPALVAHLKMAIPASDRRWEKFRGRWLVTTHHQQTLVNITQQHFGRPPLIQQTLVGHLPLNDTRLLEVLYIGACKERDDLSVSAYGFCDGDWSVVLPQDVLTAWFLADATSTPQAARTLYAALNVARDADQTVIKKAYRNMAKRFHPDVSKDPDAPEMFIRIQNAYEVLSDPLMRRRYDAGLALEASLSSSQQELDRLAAAFDTYRPPLRCGWILADGTSSLGRFQVTRIHQWEDIVNNQGQILVTSWPNGARIFTSSWV